MVLTAVVLAGMVLSGCRPVAALGAAPAEPTPMQTVGASTAALQQAVVTARPTLHAAGVWADPAVPQSVRSALAFPWVESASQADCRLVPLTGDPGEAVSSAEWVYALVAPFPTVIDDLSMSDLHALWRGKQGEQSPVKQLLMTAETRAVFTSLWGAPAPSAVEVLGQEEILGEAWGRPAAWALLPFDQLEPRWKVIRIDNLSPLEKGLDLPAYPLVARFGLEACREGVSAPEITTRPATNRDEEKMTVLIMSGTTAMVRYLALRMEENGVDYPAEVIGETLRSADITHVSNEVPFDPNCPPAKPLRREARFCSDPSYIKLLEDVGTDLVELTGNHELDWGPGPFLFSLGFYREHGLPYYGGGKDLAEALKPLLIEDHGNRLAFIGCNAMGPDTDLATATTPGSAPCDLDDSVSVLADLKAKGYLPIFTFQHFEWEEYRPHSAQRSDFRKIAEAGAVIVSGSQAHFPQGMKFVGQSFVHYGLGNLFFDQMMEGNRRAFIDRHVIYDGRYLSTELLTTLLEDYARPRWMTPEERQKLLDGIFKDGEWEDVTP